MRYKGREISPNLDDRHMTKVDKETTTDPIRVLTPQGTMKEMGLAELDRIRDKYALKTINQTVPDPPPTHRRYKKNIDAKDHSEFKNVQMPRKRPSQVYIDAPKPRTRKANLRGTVDLKYSLK